MKDKKAEKREFFRKFDFIAFELSINIENLKEIVRIYFLMLFIKNNEIQNYFKDKMAKTKMWPNGGQKNRESKTFRKSDFISFEL